ncbi:hypothetical protein MNBD_GAMMA08-1654 [hydrothermal vent metagenome]|uniref:Uncharacterized protein n=1 Tax=hydrothermal vent metagenome TaxID=652676 RepID=A0A3B0XRH0_9ZZZZ
MAKSIASINSLLVSLKTVNNSLPLKLQQLGFNTNLSLGAEQEYTVKTLMNAIDTLAVQFLTITANRNQFIQRTSYNERMEIESCLNSLLSCLQQTKLELSSLQPNQILCDANMALFYTSESDEYRSLKLLDAVHFIDMIKPYCRMLEMIIAQERIHALSAVLETLLSKENTALTETDNELTEEQSNAIELSQYLIRQAL